ncbi:MAG: SDR family oxidoreductase [Dehalococcoidia bacterium]|jgi:citronellol/citronellal dehydrogenase|nr:SDR family oxidoreductase [Chloroflexota bacterium]MCK4242396.1 SDR family oxidoreductase [Dehalococcoidia bacterium]
MKLEGKVAIVTGASRGIGKAIALALATEGADVVIAARTEEEKGPLPGTIHKTADEIRALGRRALAIKTDIAKEEEVEAMVRRTIDEFGGIDILVNNAGIDIPGTLVEVSIKRWDLIMAVNLRGAFLCTKAVLPKMMEQKRGSIINLSSILGTRVIESGVPYGVTKAAIERFTSGLAKEVKEYNIAVNALCPGYTDTEGVRLWYFNVDRSLWQKPEMWGRYAVFLACQDASSLTGRILTAEELEKECGQGSPY